jgi:hypothetical protein
MNLKNTLNVEYYHYNDQTNKLKIIDDNFIEIHLIGYPFKQPHIFINGKKYTSYLYFKGERLHYWYNILFDQCCWVCTSFACHWHSIVCIKDIVEEIRKFKKYKQKIIECILLDSVMKKYNIPFELKIYQYL